jgi:gliding motility-associated-like protein
MRLIYLNLFIIVLFSGSGAAAVLPPHDSPCTPYYIGPLNPASPCPFSVFTTPVILGNQSNIGATPEFPMPSLVNCQNSSGDMPSSMSDVWYKFVPDGQRVSLLITGQGNNPLGNPTVALYQYTGSCLALVPVDCAKGSFGVLSATFEGLISGAEYLLQVGGATQAEMGDFTLFLGSSINCLSCSQNGVLLVDPAPVNGYYDANQLVNFCYVVNGYKQVNGNSIHGMVPVFGTGWDGPSLLFNGVQTTTGQAGNWIAYNYLSLPNIGTQRGYFFDGTTPDGNPTNNTGDAGGITDNWKFCWSIKTNNCPSASRNLNMTVHLFSDGTTGQGAPPPGCLNDDPYHFAAVLNCCGDMNVSVTPESCPGACDGSITASFNASSTFMPLYDFYWFDGTGSTVQTLTAQPGNSDILSSACSGNYVFAVTSATNPGCFLAENIHLKNTFEIIHTTQTVFPCVNNNNASAGVNVQPPSAYTYSWLPSGGTGSIGTGLSVGTTYTVTVSNGNCTQMDTITPVAAPPNDPFFMYPSQFLAKCQTGLQFVDPLYVATPGGSFFCSTPGIVNPTTGTISMANTVISANYVITYQTPGPCPKMDSLVITILPQDTAYFSYPVSAICSYDPNTIFPDTVAAYGGTWAVSPSGLAVDSVSGIITPPFYPGSYTITYTSVNQGSCQAQHSELLTVVAVPPAPTGQLNYTFCPGDNSLTMTLSAACLCTIIWDDDPNFASPNSTSPTFIINPSTDPLTWYALAIEGTAFCVGPPVQVTVTPAAAPPVTITSSDSTVCPGVTGTLHAGSSNLLYSWAPPGPLNNSTSPDPDFAIHTSTIFTVYVTDPNTGCTSSSQFLVVVDSSGGCDTLIIYSGFSPNGDHLNEVWIIDGIHLQANNTVTIFNRWGERVWRGENYDNRKVVWDGKNEQGSDLPAGTYYYIIQFSGTDTPARKSWVELTR